MRSLWFPLPALAALAISAPAATFHKDIAPILQARCQGCHRPGEVAPFSMLTYKDARPWAKAMREAVITRKMPPWFADPKHGKFINDPSLSEKEIAAIKAWTDAGAPEGDPKDAPKPVPFADGWQIGVPEHVIQMQRPFQVPAKGTIEYQHIVIPTGFKDDRWIQFAEVRPGNRKLVHHVIAYVREPGSSWLRNARPGEPVPIKDVAALPANIVAGFAPGLPPAILNPGMGMLIKAGSDIVLQMHYTANGTPGSDQTKVGFIFSKQPVTQRVVNLAPHNRKFEIPAGAANHRVTATLTMEQPATLLSLMPHMHYRGKSFEYRAVYPSGKREVLLSVPKFDFNWQLYYALAKTIDLPKGTRIECTAYFDNSANNKYNPDAKSPVRWGDQTWEEMMIGWLYVSIPLNTRPADFVREKDAAPATE